MRVIKVTQFGGPEVLEVGEADEPAAGPGQVVVDVSDVPLLFVDTQIRSGSARDWFPTAPPYVPGAGVARKVSSIGEGVNADWVGADVVFDGVGGETGEAAFEVTARGGRFSAHGPSGGFAQIDAKEAEQRHITVRGIEHVQFAPADAERLTQRAMADAVAGRIRPVIGQTFPSERATEAHAAIERRDVIARRCW